MAKLNASIDTRINEINLFRFIQSPLGDMKKQYVDSITEADEEIKQLEKTQKYWERSASDAQGNLKDILQGPRR
jgi:prefoldin subunit 1